jgi:hypothetical protein
VATVTHAKASAMKAAGRTRFLIASTPPAVTNPIHAMAITHQHNKIHLANSIHSNLETENIFQKM